MAEAITIDFSLPLPVFPLPSCTLLPHSSSNLHVFEPRYRAMVRDALDSRQLIAMAVFEGDDWKSNYQGAPAVKPIVCVGYIVRHRQTDDGRYYLLLQGVCRAEIVQETHHDDYRMALLAPTEHHPIDEADLDDQRGLIEQRLNDPLLRELADISAIHNWLSDEIPTSALIDLTVIQLFDDTTVRYNMLAEPHAGQRAASLIQLLDQTRQSLEIVRRFEGRLPDDNSDPGAELPQN